MKRTALAFLILVLLAAGVHSQEKADSRIDVEKRPRPERTIKPETIELITPWVFNGQRATPSEERRRKSCLDFESLSYDCTRFPSVSYGDRIGLNWDLFQVHGGVIDRTRMVEIGKYNWTDKFTVPYVEPWRALAPGEKRAITINSSGTPVARSRRSIDGIAGMNGDGTYTAIPRPQPADKSSASSSTGGKTYATANVKEQVSSTVKSVDGKVRDDAYSPEVEVKKGYMYVAHVVDQTHDYYVLIHVDDLVRGERVLLSFVKLELFAL